jgi:DMSO/TMAO reductase YedYZ molybdopterin-dependent catalytic subunit
MDDVIVSPDARRPHRLPPGQARAPKLAVLHVGEVPPFDPATWDLAVFPVPLVDRVARFTWAEFQRLPRVKVFADVHCVTGWSHLDNLWEGVPTRALLDHVRVADAARFVMVHAEYGFSSNLPADDFFAEDALLATHHNGEPLTPEHGAPVRLVVPRLYAYKSVKWVRGVELMSDDRPGFWEQPENGGYAMRGDPWAEDRRRPGGGISGAML